MCCECAVKQPLVASIREAMQDQWIRIGYVMISFKYHWQDISFRTGRIALLLRHSQNHLVVVQAPALVLKATWPETPDQANSRCYPCRGARVADRQLQHSQTLHSQEFAQTPTKSYKGIDGQDRSRASTTDIDRFHGRDMLGG